MQSNFQTGNKLQNISKYTTIATMYFIHGHLEWLKASSVNVRNICGMKTKKQKQKQNVLKDWTPVLGHSYNTAWIQRLEKFGWDLYFWKGQLA